MERRSLTELERLKAVYGGDAAPRKAVLLSRLARRRLGTAREVLRLHEALCFLRAYPDDAKVLARVEEMLAAFPDRADLARHRKALADSGVAGTAIHMQFFAGTAQWLSLRWGDRLSVDWNRFEKKAELERLLPLLSLYAETPGLDEVDFGTRGWVDTLKGPGETDATFLLRRFAALPVGDLLRQTLYEGLEMPLVIAPGEDTPSRTRAKVPASLEKPPVFQTAPLHAGRPDVRAEVARPPVSIRTGSGADGQRLIDLAREAMATRNRDLDVFEYGDPRDVRLVDCGEGLMFACIGAIPERRLLLETVYGLLTLKNGVPTGYVLLSALFGSSEIAFNVFETFRGGESGHIYGKVLSVAHNVFGADTFTIFPYQLGGYDNPEALQSGAWWFYQKLGFRPRHAGVRRLMNAELAATKKDPSHRSSIPTLERLAAHNLYYHLGKEREDVIGILDLPEVGLKVTAFLARTFGADREEAARASSREARKLLGLPSLGGFSAGERLAWERWAPLVCILPGLPSWTTEEKRALAGVIRAKGGRHESDFTRLFDAHRPLRQAIRKLARP